MNPDLTTLFNISIKVIWGGFLVVKWLILCPLQHRATDSIPFWGTKISHAT